MTRVAAYALCVEDDAILLSRIAPGYTANADGKWTLPGGGVEFGEHPRAAAVRELEEETGLVGEVVELAEVDSWASRFVNPEDAIDTDFHGIRIIYRVRVVGGELRVEVGGSSDACAWVPRAELSGLPLVELARVGVRLAGLGE
ncbi:MAG TPA: NUDIX domain-containing protein [Candidatus Limnocylindria bacterium]